MATGTGLEAQLGYAIETTNGVAVTVTRFIPFMKESIVEEQESIVCDAIIAGRLTPDTEQRKLGVKSVKGSVETQLFRENQASLWQWALGAVSSVSTGGSAPYTHTFSLADSNPSATIQKGVPEADGGTTAFTYAGCKVASWSFSGAKGQPSSLKFDVVGSVAETTGIALAAASFGNNSAVPFIFTEGSAKVNTVALPVESFECNFDNKLVERVYAGDTISRDFLRGGRLGCSGKLTVEYNSTTEYALAKAGTDIDIELKFTDGTQSVTVTLHTFLEKPATPTVQGTGVTMYDLTWADLYGDATDADALAVVVVNSGSITP
jgi:hypothetical protein